MCLKVWRTAVRIALQQPAAPAAAACMSCAILGPAVTPLSWHRAAFLSHPHAGLPVMQKAKQLLMTSIWWASFCLTSRCHNLAESHSCSHAPWLQHMLCLPVLIGGFAPCRSRYGSDEGQPSRPAHPTGKCSLNALCWVHHFLSIGQLREAASWCGRRMVHRAFVPVGAQLVIYSSVPCCFLLSLAKAALHGTLPMQ